MRNLTKPLTVAGLLLLGACASAPTVYKDVHQGNMFVSQSNPRMTIQVDTEMEAWETYETNDEVGPSVGRGKRSNVLSTVYPFVRMKNGLLDKGFLVVINHLPASWYKNEPDDSQNDVLINGIKFNRRWGPFHFKRDMIKILEKHGAKISPHNYAAFVSYSLNTGRSTRISLYYLEVPPANLSDMRDWKSTGFTSGQLAFRKELFERSERSFKVLDYSAF